MKKINFIPKFSLKTSHLSFGKLWPYLLTGLGLLLIIGGSAAKPTPQATLAATPDQVTVTLTDSGFSPDFVVVKFGGTVTFQNNRGKSFWPASNLHPTHTIYPEFDPKKPINPGEPWTFRFEKTGTWNYHDHLVPGFTGTILVEGEEQVDVSIDACQKNANASIDERSQCWSNQISESLKYRGVTEAFKVIKLLYQTDPFFRADGCHKHAHLLGDFVYAAYLKNKDFSKLDFPPESVSCGYGFYHGFLEHLFRSNPNIELARKFCDNLIGKLESSIPDIRLNCYHGMGHGFMREPPAEEDWGNPGAIALPALKMCDQVSPSGDRDEIYQCQQGTFNVLADWVQERRYDLIPLNEEDPLKVCSSQPEYSYKYNCYYEFSMRVAAVGKDDLLKIAKLYFEPIEDETIALMGFNSAVTGVIERATNKDSYDDYISICYKLKENFRKTCLTGIVGSLIANAEPGLEHIKALRVCQSTVVLSEDRADCYKHLFARLRTYYPKDKFDKFCQEVEPNYRKDCTYPNEKT